MRWRGQHSTFEFFAVEIVVGGQEVEIMVGEQEVEAGGSDQVVVENR